MKSDINMLKYIWPTHFKIKQKNSKYWTSEIHFSSIIFGFCSYLSFNERKNEMFILFSFISDKKWIVISYSQFNHFHEFNI